VLVLFCARDTVAGFAERIHRDILNHEYETVLLRMTVIVETIRQNSFDLEFGRKFLDRQRMPWSSMIDLIRPPE
jgi:hypothetical protein